MKRIFLILFILFLIPIKGNAERFTIQKGATDQTIYISVWDSSSSTGGKLTGLVYNSAGLTCYYTRVGAAAAQLTLATQTVTGTHSDGGFVEVSSTNAPGQYRLDLSDAIVASGVDRVKVECKGATNMVQSTTDIELVGYDPFSALSTLTQSQVTGGAYALDTDSNGRIRIVDGTGPGEIDTNAGTILLTSTTETQIDNIENQTNKMNFTGTNINAQVKGMDTNVLGENQFDDNFECKVLGVCKVTLAGNLSQDNAGYWKKMVLNTSNLITMDGQFNHLYMFCLDDGRCAYIKNTEDDPGGDYVTLSEPQVEDTWTNPSGQSGRIVRSGR